MAAVLSAGCRRARTPGRSRARGCPGRDRRSEPPGGRLRPGPGPGRGSRQRSEPRSRAGWRSPAPAGLGRPGRRAGPHRARPAPGTPSRPAPPPLPPPPPRSSTNRCGARAWPASSRERSRSLSIRSESLRASAEIPAASAIRSSSLSESESSAAPAAEHRRDRRAQIVGDRTQQCRLDLIATTERLGLDRRGDQPLAIRCGAQQMSRERAPRGARGAPERQPGRSRWRRPAWPICSAIARKGDPPVPRGRRRLVELDPGPGTDRRRLRPESQPSPRANRRRCSLPSSAVASCAAEVRLPPPLLGLFRPPPSMLGQGAGDHRRDQEDAQRHPVLAVRDLDVPRRGDMEEVEGGGAEDRGQQCRPASRVDRNGENTEQIDDAGGDGQARSSAGERSAPCIRRPPRPRAGARPRPRRSSSARPSGVSAPRI